MMRLGCLFCEYFRIPTGSVAEVRDDFAGIRFRLWNSCYPEVVAIITVALVLV